MKTVLLLGIGGLLKSLQAVLVGWGALGILIIALLDAGLVPLPGGLDVVLMTLAHLNPRLAPLYVLAAILGSTFGCLAPYWIGRKMGEAALRKFSAEKRARVSALLDRYEFWAMLVGAVAPPGFPFKPLLVTAGVFKMKVVPFLAALAIGRTIRFSLEGWMAVRYGDQAMAIFKQHYPKIGLGIIAAIVVIFLFNSLLKRRREATS